MLRDYYERLFPIPDRKSIMRQQIVLSKYIQGFSPDVTDDMEYKEFIEWYNEASDFYEELDEDAE